MTGHVIGTERTGELRIPKDAHHLEEIHLDRIKMPCLQRHRAAPGGRRLRHPMVNQQLAIEGILMTMYDGRLRLCNQVVSEVRRHFEDIVFNTIIHRNSKLSEAPSVGKPVILYDGNSKGSADYLNLAKEILQNNNIARIRQEERILELRVHSSESGT